MTVAPIIGWLSASTTTPFTSPVVLAGVLDSPVIIGSEAAALPNTINPVQMRERILE
jgi:hypothetical protein